MYYSPWHPAILHSIKRVAEAGKSAGIPVSICGEMASDPLCALLLAGLGISDLSMSSPSIPIVKQAVRGASFETVSEIAARVLQLESSSEIQSVLKESTLELGIAG